MNLPHAITFDANGNMFISESGYNRIRLVQNGTIQTIVGLTPAQGTGDGGPAISARLNVPWVLAVDTNGNLYIAEFQGNRIRMVTPAASPDLGTAYGTGIISTIQGNGVQGSGPDQMNQPAGVAVDAAGDIFMTDTFNHRLLELTASGSMIEIAGTGTAGFSGDNGPASNALINLPTGVVVGSDGSVYFSDYNNGRLRILIPTGAVPALLMPSRSPIKSGTDGTLHR